MKYIKGDKVEIIRGTGWLRDHEGEIGVFIDDECNRILVGGLECAYRVGFDEVKKVHYFAGGNNVQRKDMPAYSGVLKYFPDAILELSRVSVAGSKQHNPGKPLFWDRSKSGDELDSLTRHLIDEAKDPHGFDSDGIRHSARIAWRALANLQKEIESSKVI